MASMKARGAPAPSAASSRGPSYQRLQLPPSRLVRMRMTTAPRTGGTSHVTPTIVKSSPTSSVTVAGGAACTVRVPCTACGATPNEPASVAERASPGAAPSDVAAVTMSRSATARPRVFTVSGRSHAATASLLRGAAQAAARSAAAMMTIAAARRLVRTLSLLSCMTLLPRASSPPRQAHQRPLSMTAPMARARACDGSRTGGGRHVVLLEQRDCRFRELLLELGAPRIYQMHQVEEVLGHETARLDEVVEGHLVLALEPVSYTHLRAHETDSYLVCRLL